jgi:serine/threonine-protein kinase Chk2
LSDEVEDEVKEGVWGYLFPLDTRHGGRCVVLKKRTTCPCPDDLENTLLESKQQHNKSELEQEETYEKSKIKGEPSGGYLIGRHPECGKFTLKLDRCSPCSPYPWSQPTDQVHRRHNR